MAVYGRQANLEILSRIPLLAGLSMGALGQVARIADECDLRDGKVLITEGGPGGKLFVLLTGGADVRRKGRKIATMTRGDFFGEISLLTNRPATATVTLTEDSTLLAISRDGFRRLLREKPTIQRQVLDALAERMPGD